MKVRRIVNGQLAPTEEPFEAIARQLTQWASWGEFVGPRRATDSLKGGSGHGSLFNVGHMGQRHKNQIGEYDATSFDGHLNISERLALLSLQEYTNLFTPSIPSTEPMAYVYLRISSGYDNTHLLLPASL